MPHMIDRDVVQEMWEEWPDEWDQTSASRFRGARNMQYAFSHFYYITHAKESVDPVKCVPVPVPVPVPLPVSVPVSVSGGCAHCVRGVWVATPDRDRVVHTAGAQRRWPCGHPSDDGVGVRLRACVSPRKVSASNAALG